MSKPYVLIIILLSLLNSSYGHSVNYNHQDMWMGNCQSGKRQSPIDIITSQTTYDSNYRFEMRPFEGEILLNPKGVDLANPFPGSQLSLVDGNQELLLYEGLQYHWRAPS